MIDRRSFSIGVATALTSFSTSSMGSDGKVTFLGWSHDEAANKATLAAVFDRYRLANPSAKLDAIGYPFGQIQQNILLRLRSGQPLDVAQIAERWLPQFAATGKLVDLNGVYGAAALAKLIDPNILRLGERRGKQLGLPWTAGSIGMVANGKVLKDAGVIDVPETIDGFLSALRAIKRAQPQSVPYAMTTKNNNSLVPDFQVWLWTFGGEFFDEQSKVSVNSAAGIRALSFMVDLVREGLAAKDIDRPDARRLFAQHQTAFYNDAPLARGFARNNSGKGIDFDQFVLAAATPVLRQGDRPQSFAWGHLLSLFKTGGKSDAKSPAALFAAHLALDDASQLQYFREQGLFPVTRSALAQLSSDRYVSTWTKAAAHARRDQISEWANSADLTTVIGEEVQSALIGQRNPQECLERMEKRMNAKISEMAKS